MTITQSLKLKWKTKVFGEKKEITQISKTEEDLRIQKKKKKIGESIQAKLGFLAA